MRTKEKNIDKSFIFVLITAFCFGTMEIALKLGYSSGFALSRAFSGKYGCPPKSLIKKRTKSETDERKS